MPLSSSRLAAAALLLLTLGTSAVHALTPIPRPAAYAGIEPGLAIHFAGAWSVTLPTMEVGSADTNLAICDLPVRIEAANQTHIFYLGPSQAEADAAIELIVVEDGTAWEPIAGGPNYFAIWTSADSFYLFDALADEALWGQPFIYARCPDQP